MCIGNTHDTAGAGAVYVSSFIWYCADTEPRCHRHDFDGSRTTWVVHTDAQESRCVAAVHDDDNEGKWMMFDALACVAELSGSRSRCADLYNMHLA